MHSSRRRTLTPTGLTLVVLIVVGGPMLPARGEMRKSWQSKSVDTQSQLLKAARVDDPPSAKPPERSEADLRSAVEEPSERLESTTTFTSPGSTTAEPKPKPAVLYSSRVRNKYGTVVAPVVPEQPKRREDESLEFEHPHPEEIQVDDATVQDDDDDEDDEDDEDDLLGWAGGKPNREQYDLIENILEEVEGRVAGVERKEDDVPARSGRPAGPKEYTFPPVLNMTVDEPNSIVKVKLNQDIVRDMLNTGREAGGGIGGKKMLRYVLPLFILPFLIQSAVIPFMLTSVKLFLLKSLMAGKLAIFLLLLGAFKNFTKKDRDVYVKDLPDRRYEPSSEGFAYLAEGRPSGWIN